MSKRILITGGCGFVGHHFVEHILRNTDWEIVILDNLGYSSTGFERLRDINAYEDDRILMMTWDITKPITANLASEIGDINYIVHMAAETHVDNSFKHPEIFVKTNVIGTLNMLEYARQLHKGGFLEKFIYFSTDEVFGPAPEGTFYKEWDRYKSSNPYAASKAGGEELTIAYGNSYKLPVMITHTMNVFGERQYYEKFIPLVINKVLNGEMITIHSAEDLQTSGSRFYVHARNVAAAILFLLIEGQCQDKYNIVGEQEVTNFKLAEFIARILDKPFHYKMVDFHSSRPGHDLRYALDGTKLQKMGHYHPKTFTDSLKKTIQWSLANSKWLCP